MKRNRIYIYTSLIYSLLPLGLLYFYGFETSFFGLIDTLVASTIIFTVYMSTIMVSKNLHYFTYILISTILITFYKVSIEYFNFYQTYIVYDIIPLYKDLISASSNFDLSDTLPLLIIVIATPFFIEKSRPEKISKRSSLIIISCSITIIFCGTIFHSKSFDSQYHNTRVLQDENPILLLFRSTPIISSLYTSNEEIYQKKSEKFIINQIKNDNIETLPEYISAKNYRNLIPNYPSYSVLSTEQNPLLNVNKSKVQFSQKRKNVILIVMESLRTLEANNKSITPNLNKIISQSISVESFYATNRTTVKSEVSILCSLPDTSPYAPFSVVSGKVDNNCLPKILSNKGYETIWMHGNTTEFFNRKLFHPTLGFNKVFGKEYFREIGYSEDDDIGWGVSDKNVFLHSLKFAESIEKPFFMEILSLTNHQPFTWDVGREYQNNNLVIDNDENYTNYAKTVNYADYALGKFFESFIKSKISNNTVLIITGDHGVPYYPSSHSTKAEDKIETLYKVPLVIFEKGKEHEKLVETAYSHFDLAPTILSILDIRYTNTFLGRPFLGKDATTSPRPIFLLDHNYYHFKFDDVTCYDPKKVFHVTTCNDGKIDLRNQSKSLLNYLNIYRRANYHIALRHTKLHG